jgi:hydrogenase maturation protease
MTPLVVLAVGNDARGDDALGPRLLARLAGLELPGVRTVLDFQFQVEHALDLDEADEALFVDAHCAQESAAALAALAPAAGVGAASHALAPAEVLAVRRSIGKPVPPAWLLSLRGVSFELGEGLSGEGERSLEAGWLRLREFLRERRLI